MPLRLEEGYLDPHVKTATADMRRRSAAMPAATYRVDQMAPLIMGTP
ncbi:hypothetical protein ACVC7V_15390 [Hydrogenophaga sp. A37]